MRCPHCGADIPNESKRCDQCGRPVVPAPGAPGRTLQVADNSGSTIGSHNSTQTTANTSNTTVTIDRSNSDALILALVVIAVAVVLLAGYLWYTQQRDEVVRIQATATAFMTATAQAATATSQAIAAAYERGVAAMEIGDWQTAHTALRSVFEHDPNYRDVKDRMGAVIAALTPTATTTPPATAAATDTPTTAPTPSPTPSPKATVTSEPTASPMATAMVIPTRTPVLTATLVVERAEQAMTPSPAPPPSVATSDNGKPGVARILVEGFGVAPAALTDPTRRQRSAIQAAEVDAKRKLAEWIAGALVEAVTLVDQGTVTTDTVRLTVQARVPAARTVTQSYDAATGTATVQIELIVDSASPP